MLIALRDKNRGVLFRPLQEGRGYTFIAMFPFPQVFGLRRLRTAIRLVRFGYDTFTECVV